MAITILGNRAVPLLLGQEALHTRVAPHKNDISPVQPHEECASEPRHSPATHDRRYVTANLMHNFARFAE